MAGREDFLFWRLGLYLLTEGNYRLIRINQSHTEMWLENSKNKAARIIRLVRSDLNWSNWVKRDQQFVAIQSEKLRRHFFARQLNVLNIYILPYILL